MVIHVLDPAMTNQPIGINNRFTLSSALKSANSLIKERKQGHTYVSEKDFLVFLCRFETTILAANCIKQIHT